MRYLIFGGILIFGLAVVFLGIVIRVGCCRWIYAGRSMPIFAQREVANLLIPIGLGFLSIALPIVYPSLKYWADYVLYFSFVALIVLAIWQPWWLKPAWFRWLENNYGHVLEDMFAEARKIGRFNWAKQVKTQADLERWADNAAQKHGWRRLR